MYSAVLWLSPCLKVGVFFAIQILSDGGGESCVGLPCGPGRCEREQQHVVPFLITNAESPIWVARNKTLYWVDITGRKLLCALHKFRCIFVHAFSSTLTGGRELPVVTLPAQVGCIVPRRSGGLLACLENTIVPICPLGSVGTPLCSLPPTPSMRFNDGAHLVAAWQSGCSL